MLGYCVVRQSEDGMIHLVASNVRPLLHFEFNEAWLLSENDEAPSEAELMVSHASCYPQGVKEYKEYWPDGTLRCRYSGGIADDGRFLLDGAEELYYPDGSRMSTGFFHLGKRMGTYTYYDQQGNPCWMWEYKEGGKAVYRTYHSHSSQLKTVCPFIGRIAEGIAQTFDRNGKVTEEVTYQNGCIVHRTNLQAEPPAPMGEIF